MLHLFKVAEVFAKKYPDSIFFDVGSNIGIFTYFIVRLNRKCHSFEPHEYYFNILKTRLKFLKIEKKFKRKIVYPSIHKLGISKEIDTLNLNHSSLSGSHSFIKEDTPAPNNKKSLCQVTTLDNYFKINLIEKKPIFIKIDIEGYEENALLGSLSVIKNYKPTFFIEVRKNNIKSKNTYEKILKILIPMGYKLINSQKEILDYANDSDAHFDVLLCYKDFWDLKFISGDLKILNRKQKFYRIIKRLFNFQLSDLHHLAIRKPFDIFY